MCEVLLVSSLAQSACEAITSSAAVPRAEAQKSRTDCTWFGSVLWNSHPLFSHYLCRTKGTALFFLTAAPELPASEIIKEYGQGIFVTAEYSAVFDCVSKGIPVIQVTNSRPNFDLPVQKFW